MKKLRILRLLSIFTIATAGVLAGAIFKSKKEASNDDIAEVKAESYYGTVNIYFLPHDQWVQNGNERFKMNVFNGGTYLGWVEMGLYGVSTVPGPYYNRKMYKASYSWDPWISRVQFCRMSADFGTEYNCSSQIYLTGDGDTQVLMTNHDLNYWSNWNTDTSGVWLTPNVVQHAVYKTSDQSPSSSTGRVFFYNSGTHWASAAGCAVYAWGGSASPTIWSGHSETCDATLYNLNWFTDDNGESYGYADIPTNVSGYKFCTITNVNEYVTATGYFSETSFIPDSFAYVRYGLQNGNTINSGGAKNDVAGANLMKKVIQAYNTCSSSVLNGYGAYNALNTNFYSHATASAKSATEKSLGGSTATIQAHFEAMQYRSVNGLPSSVHNLLFLKNTEKAPIYLVVVIVSIVAISSIGGYFFYTKRKESN